VLDVHAGASVDLGRVLAGQQRDLHRGCILAATAAPASPTTGSATAAAANTERGATTAKSGATNRSPVACAPRWTSEIRPLTRPSTASGTCSCAAEFRSTTAEPCPSPQANAPSATHASE